MTDDLRAYVPTFERLPMSVALVAMYWNSGEPHRGVSYEYSHFYRCFSELFEKVHFYDFLERSGEVGKEAMSREVVELVRKERPDLTLVPLFKDDFVPGALDEIRNFTTSVAYFFDDPWRWEYAKAWVPHFDYFTTPQRSTLLRWRELGYANVVYSPFGYNHYFYRPLALPLARDTTFVGGYHPYRYWLVKRLRKAGYSVDVWGNAWPNGVIDPEGMVDVLNSSKINLNMSDCVNYDVRYLLSTHHRGIRNLLKSTKNKEQVKGRHFEIAGCGGFQLSYNVEDLEHHFEIGKEIAVYADADDLTDKVRYYLAHEDERAEIARAGYVRAVTEHTLVHRFLDIVARIEADAARAC